MPPSLAPLSVPMASSSSHPLCCCAWPGPTSPLTLTSELSYKYDLSILVTFPKKCFQVINTQASATLPALPPGWLGAGGSIGLKSGEGKRRTRTTCLPQRRAAWRILGVGGSGRKCVEETERYILLLLLFLIRQHSQKREKVDITDACLFLNMLFCSFTSSTLKIFH